MKKVLALSIALVMIAVLATGCGAKKETPDNWPQRGISLVVPFKAGGDTDFYARLYAQYLEKELGQTVTVVNTEGAGGTVGAQSVADATNDGYTMLFYHTGNLYANKMLGVSDLDQNSFEIACIGEVDDTNTLCVGTELGIDNIEDFIKEAQANPEKISCAVTISGFSYYTMCRLCDAVGMKLNPVDKGGAADMIPALMGNQLDAGINSYGVFAQYVKDGSIIPLVTFGEERSQYFPDVPTVKELGYDCSAARYYFFGFPKGTDAKICQKVSDAVAKIQNNADYCSAVSGTYCVTPKYIPYAEVKASMDDMWSQMEPYTEVMNK